MAYLEILQKHNADLGGLIEKANSLPEKGDLGKQVDALIDGTITEVNSGATSVRGSLFKSVTSLKSANFSNATSIGYDAFNGCSNLNSANFPSAISIGGNAFYNCTALNIANFPNAKSIGGYAFYACSALKKADFPNVETVGQYAFFVCRLLESIDLAKAKKIETYAFSACNSLKSVILRSETVCTLATTQAFNACYHILGTKDSDFNPNGDKDGYIYVPRALVESYQSATNWSTFSTQFRALEDYTVDGTTTGALDPNKI